MLIFEFIKIVIVENFGIGKYEILTRESPAQDDAWSEIREAKSWFLSCLCLWYSRGLLYDLKRIARQSQLKCVFLFESWMWLVGFVIQETGFSRTLAMPPSFFLLHQDISGMVSVMLTDLEQDHNHFRIEKWKFSISENHPLFYQT